MTCMQHISDSNVQYFLSGAGHLVESSQKHKVKVDMFINLLRVNDCMSAHGSPPTVDASAIYIN